MTSFERLVMRFFKHTDITKIVDGETVVYLRRFFIRRSRTKGKGGNIYLHHILRSDDDPDPHNHPWGFRTFILSGGYMDESWSWIDGLGRIGPTWDNVPFLGVRYRKASHIHRVILPRGKTAWTLVFTGKYEHSWSFITTHGPIPWRIYLGIPEGQIYEGD